jgi:transposase
MITIETWAYIRRLYLHDGVSISAIAAELGLDRKTVRRAIRTDNFLEVKEQPRRCSAKLDAFKPAIDRMLEKTPHLSGVRIIEKLRPLGYGGGKSILNEYLATLPQRQGEVFLRIESGPGEQAQCDWGQCGTLVVGNTKRVLSCLVMTLAYSRFLYVHFYLSETMEHFLDGHVRAFAAFGGVPQTMVYDNLKSVVLQRHGKNILFNSTLMDFAGYHLFKPDPCRPRAPHLKGKVERGVGFVKNNFLAGREELFAPPATLALINHECAKWLTNVNNRVHGTTHQRPSELLVKEHAQLLPLPVHPYDIALKKSIYADQQAFVNFQTNLYSVPPEAVGKPLMLNATPYRIEIYHERGLVAAHERSFEKSRVFEKPEHRQQVLRHKRRARHHKQRDFFLALGEVAENFLGGLTLTGARISHHLERIMQLVDIYGKTEVLAALEKACEHGAYHCEYIENIIQQRRLRPESARNYGSGAGRAQENSPTAPRPGAKHKLDIRLRDIDMSQYHLKTEDNDE